MYIQNKNWVLRWLFIILHDYLDLEMGSDVIIRFFLDYLNYGFVLLKWF